MNKNIEKFDNSYKDLKKLGLEIIEEEIKLRSNSKLSTALFGDRTGLTKALKRIEKGESIDRPKIGRIAEIVRRIKKLYLNDPEAKDNQK